MLKKVNMQDFKGRLYRGYFIYNRLNKALAIGADSTTNDPGFCFMTAKRYQNDKDLMKAIERLIGHTVECRHK